MKALVISGGKPPSQELIYEELKDSSLLIAVDSGANVLYNLGIAPDLILGDFDSIDKEVLEYFKAKDADIVKYPPEKDFTDSEIAINLLIERNYHEIVLLGCTGSRMDHFLGNLGLLKKCLLCKVKATIKDDNNSIFITDRPLILKGKPKQIISFQAFGEEVSDFTIKNARYPLNNYNLKIGDPLTVSNEFIEGPMTIEFEKGYVLVIYAKD